MDRMVREKTLNLAGRVVTVKEFSVRDIRNLIDSSDDGFWNELAQMLKVGTGLGMDDLNPFTFSELERLYDTMMEVNTAFFDLARKLGLSGLGEKIREILVASFTDSFSASWNEVMPTCGTMDGPCSSTPSKPPANLIWNRPA